MNESSSKQGLPLKNGIVLLIKHFPNLPIDGNFNGE
jgi:hypothetical protein